MAKSQARTDFQRAVDDILTGIINNDPKARKFILARIAELTDNLTSRFSVNADKLVQVFVKGNSALTLYRMNTITDNRNHNDVEFNKLNQSWSDFDNQIIINPYLPKVWWYEILGQIDHLIKTQTLQYARDNFVIHEKAEGDQGDDNPDLPKADDRDQVKRPTPPPADDYGSGQDYNGYRSLEKIRIHGAELKKGLDNDYRVKYPDIAGGFNLGHEIKMQSNVELCMGSEYLHPVNYFDNIRTLFPRQHGDLNFMNEADADANDFFPPAVHVLKDHLGKKVKEDSSIWINTTIGKFLLYRLIVRYRHPGLSYDGKKNRPDINSEAVKFRGEVIDISIPRRESEETLNQWTRFYDTIAVLTPQNKYRQELGGLGDKVLVPDYNYQVEENINMINEVLTYTSGSAHKFYKRLDRALPALEQIQLDSEQMPGSDLNSAVVFTNNASLDTLYSNIASNALKCYCKQLARIFDYDYFWPVLDERVQQTFIRLLPTYRHSDIVFSQAIERWFGDFNVKGEDCIDEQFKASNIIADAATNKFDQPLEQQTYERKLSELLKFTKLSHSLYQQFGESYRLTLTHVRLINGFRRLCEQLNTSKCFFGGIVSAKLDLHFRLNYPYDETYPLPVVPLYLVVKDVDKFIANQNKYVGWTGSRATQIQQQMYGYDYFLRHRDLPHIVAVKFIDTQSAPERADTTPLEQLLLEQHTCHQLLINGLEQQLKTFYVALSTLKSSEKGEQYSSGIYQVLELLKQQLYHCEQNYNLLFDTPGFGQFVELVAEFVDELGEMQRTIEKSNTFQEAEEDFYLKTDTVIENLSLADADKPGNIFRFVVDYLGKANQLLQSNVIRGGSTADHWSRAIAQINALTVGKLITGAKNLQQNHHVLLYTEPKNNRIVTEKHLEQTNTYRVLRESAIARYIDHQISTARDFYLIEWLDHNRVGYKSKAVNYTTTLVRNVQQQD